MLKRTLTFLFLCGLVFAAGLSAQQPPMIVLAPQSPPPSTAQQAAIMAALQWQVQHGYAYTDSQPVEVSIGSNGISITYHAAGGPDVTIVLSNGPIFTKPDKTVWAMNILVSHQLLEVSNGF